MSDLTITKEKNPNSAFFIERWRAKYQRQYDFSKAEEQALFYEGSVEMARHIATTSEGANLHCAASTTGVDNVTMGVVQLVTPSVTSDVS